MALVGEMIVLRAGGKARNGVNRSQARAQVATAAAVEAAMGESAKASRAVRGHAGGVVDAPSNAATLLLRSCRKRTSSPSGECTVQVCTVRGARCLERFGETVQAVEQGV